MLYVQLIDFSPESRNASRVLLVQRPATQNVRGPPLLEEFGVSQDPPVGVVVDAPVPAKDLEDLDR